MQNLCVTLQSQRGWFTPNKSLVACDECKGKEIPLYPLCMQRNITRIVKCPLHPGEDDVFIEQWARFYGDDVYVITKEPRPQRHQTWPVRRVIPFFESRLPIEQIGGTPTPIAQLFYELKQERGADKSVLQFLFKNGYSSASAIDAGLTLDMIGTCAADWDTLINERFISVKDLYNMGATFTRLLLMGMSIELFSRAEMDAASLNAIRFNRHAFVAVGGTKEQWDRIMKTADEEPHPYKWGQAVFECCEIKRT